MEYWDVYDKDRHFTGRVRQRGEKVAPGEYHIVIHGWVFNSQNQVLLTRRDTQKQYGGFWESTGGCVQAGEDSLHATVREIGEETGVEVLPEEGHLLSSRRFDESGIFYDVYLFEKDVPLSQIVCQPGEVTAAQWVDERTFAQMFERGEIVPTLSYYRDAFAYFRLL